VARSEIAVVIPAFNEADTIYDVISDVEIYGDILVIDDCSTDATRQVIEQTNAILLEHKSNLGYEAALSSGIKYAVDNNYKYIVTSDADGELMHFGISKVIELLKKGNLLVIGKRNKKNRIIEVLFGMLCSFKFKIQDPLCGMKGYTADLYRKYGFFDRRKMIGTELLAYSLRDNIAIQEAPIEVQKRHGDSRFGGSITSFFRIIRVMVLFFWISLKNKD
jgi:glycosyltransferase involved in cell wall biosynthesis